MLRDQLLLVVLHHPVVVITGDVPSGHCSLEYYLVHSCALVSVRLARGPDWVGQGRASAEPVR
jgi:hypothetical protein